MTKKSITSVAQMTAGSASSASLTMAALVGLTSIASLASFGSASSATITGRTEANVSSVSKTIDQVTRSAPNERESFVSRTSASEPVVGSKRLAALNLGRLVGVYQRLGDAAASAKRALIPLVYAPEDSLARAASRFDAVTVGGALVVDTLPDPVALPSVAHTPGPDSYVRAMQLMSVSHATKEPLEGLSRIYNEALITTVPQVLQATREGYTTAFDYFLAQARGDDHQLLRTAKNRWRAQQDRAESLLGSLQAKSALSADEILDLAKAVEEAKYGQQIRSYKRYTPIFSRTLVQPDSATFVDTMLAARQLRADGAEVFFPHVISPPNGADGGLVKVNFEALSFRGSDRSGNAELLFGGGFGLESWRRKALVNGTFPGSDLFASRPELAREIIGKLYEVGVDRRQKSNATGSWLVKVRHDMLPGLSSEARQTVHALTSTWSALSTGI